jgi:thioredoxin reductase/NAD-dependent dihydropyrimidine dehydrogenase PreA subunit
MDFLVMDQLLEYGIYGFVILFCLGIMMIYLRKLKKESRIVDDKIEQAIEAGLHEPISLYPSVNPDNCIKSGACIAACPEKDILGIRNGKATLINASRCIGHGACFHSCPVEAITLVIGTEKRGVELPHVSQDFETNVPGIFIAGELGGMGLIKNSVEQGRQAVKNMISNGIEQHDALFDLVIIGAGPAGISASLEAKKNKLKFITLEQDTLGGTVYSFPRSKVVMTAPMNLPLYGKIKLYETTKDELIELWQNVLEKHDIQIKENTKVDVIVNEDEVFKTVTKEGAEYTSKKVLLAIGRRGSPRKLNVPGEDLEKVSYRLLDPEYINGKNIMVVGGGDSAIESALLLAGQNNVSLSYRSDRFKRIKPKNNEKVNKAIESGLLTVVFNSNLLEIRDQDVVLSKGEEKLQEVIPNDMVYIFAGGELPTQFLQKAGIKITKRYGFELLKHKGK